MVDSVAVFPPGFRVLDSNGDPVNDAKIKFREVGGGAGKAVYADADLSSSLGVTVRTRSDGFPVVSFGSQTTVLVYTDTTPYHCEITDSDDVAIFPAKDNVRGALDTSDFLTSASTSTYNEPVLAKTANYTVQVGDKAKLIACNASGGFFTITLPSAITMGDGFLVGVRNDGTSGTMGIAASHNIATPYGNVLSFSLAPGETAWLTSNGATWKISKYVPNFLRTVGIIEIVDRVSSAPVSPTAGDRYIMTASTTVGSVAVATHDIIEANGQGDWIKITPPLNCGWLAYVKDETTIYEFRSNIWDALIASETIIGMIRTASVAEMVAVNVSHIAVIPSRQQYHPGHPKAWALVTVSGGTPTLAASHNIAGITDVGVGRLGLTIDTDFSTTAWCAVASAEGAGASAMDIVGVLNATRAGGAIELNAISDDGTLEDPTSWSFIGMGAQT